MITKPILLCGFMGCGKSSVGHELAELLNLPFYDMDSYIEEVRGMSIPDIFSQDGENGFRVLEHNACVYFAEQPPCIIASGGGALTFSRNIETLKGNVLIVCLDVPFANCFHRIRHTSRPIVQNSTTEELKSLYEKRKASYYAAADRIVTPSDASPRQAAMEISRLLCDV